MEEETFMLNLRLNRKMELAAISRKTGIGIAALVRSWIYEKLDSLKSE